jgi:uncharacterized surface protein with fasciclin (FAS1) repeats
MANIVETAVAAGTFKTLVEAVKAAGLVETLSGQGPFTVFAPDDDAFTKLPAGTVDSLLKDIPKLKDILTYHVVAGKIMAADVAGLTSVKTVQGKELSIDAQDGVKVNESKVIKSDIEASNGVIHVIDSVLIPS